MEFLSYGIQCVHPPSRKTEIPAFLREAQGAGSGYFRCGTEYKHVRHGNSGGLRVENGW
jgi:hypothetical protein